MPMSACSRSWPCWWASVEEVDLGFRAMAPCAGICRYPLTRLDAQLDFLLGKRAGERCEASSFHRMTYANASQYMVADPVGLREAGS